MITYQTEKFKDCIDEAKPLLMKHWDEVACDKENVPLNPDYDQYQRLCDAGVLHIVTARDDGVLVGYASWLVAVNLHYKQLVFGEIDIFFLSAECRRGLVGYKLLSKSDEYLASIGVNKIVSKDKIAHGLGPIFKRLGYEAIETVYLKTVGGV